jgi:hypothetical protein
LRVFLIILVILSYLGGVGAVAGISNARGFVPIDILLVFFIVTVCNVASAFYLYKKAARSKVEWALFGAIGTSSCPWMSRVLSPRA